MDKVFFKFFPTPKLLDFPTDGLSLSDDSISFIRFKKDYSGNITLDNYGREEITDSLIKDGEIKNLEGLSKVLSEFKKTHNLSYIKTALPEEKTFLFRTTLPKMSDSEMREALKFKIEENVPLSSDQAIFDFRIVSDSSGNEKNIIVSVLSKDTIYSYLEVFRKSGLKPVIFEVESQVVAKSVVKKEDKRPFLVIDVKKGKSGLYLIDKGLVQFTSVLNIGKDFFSSSLFLKKEEENKDLKSEAKIYIPEVNEERILKEEIEKLLAYWSSFKTAEDSKSKIEKIITCGEGVLDKNFKDYFSSYFSIPFEPANVWTNAFSLDKYVPPLSFEKSLNYAAAAGLALPSDFGGYKI